MKTSHFLFLSLLLNTTANWPLSAVLETEQQTSSSVALKPYLKANLKLTTSDPLSAPLGTARQGQTDYPLYGEWHIQEDRDLRKNIYTLSLYALINAVRVSVPQDAPLQLFQDHILVTQGAEKPGNFVYDGASVYQQRILPQRWRNPKTTIEYDCDLTTQDPQIPSHKGHSVVYVEPFQVGLDPLKDRMSLRGDYSFLRSLTDQESLSGRTLDRLLYSDGHSLYLPHVTQELWRRENYQSGFFLASYNPNKKLRFVNGSQLPNGVLDEGLYHLVSVKNEHANRIETWRRLGEDPQDFEVVCPLGVPSVAGMGVSAPFLGGQVTPPSQEIESLLTEMRSRIEGMPNLYLNAKESIIIAGPTGSGKTTLLNMMAGKQAETKRTSRGLAIHILDPLADSRISHTHQPGTELPAIFYDQAQDRAIIDCPGVRDTRGTGVDMRNAVAMQRALKDRRNLKIILAFRESLLAERSQEFVASLNDLTSLFSDIEQLKKAVSLMVTYHREADMEMLLAEIVEELQDPNNDVRKQLSPLSYQLLEFLSQHPERIGTLPYPKAVGPYQLSEQSLVGLKNAQRVEEPRFKIAFGETAQKLLSGDITRINAAMEQYIRTEVSQGIIRHCRQLVEKNTGTVIQLRQKLIAVQTALSNLAIDTAENFIQGLSGFINTEELSKAAARLKLLKSFNDTASLQLTSWKNALTHVKNLVSKFSEAPEVIQDKDTLILRGSLVGASDIKTALQTKPQHHVRIFSTHTFIVDDNITNKGKSMTVYSPHWQVLDTKTIDLSGNHGAKGADGKTPGADGSPGTPGENGGHFLGRGDTFQGMDKLTIITSGGNGGSGGNGVKGADGKNGTDDQWKLIDTICVTKEYFAENLTEYYEAQGGTDGTPGQNGGKGGIGGQKGLSGSIKVYGSNCKSVSTEGVLGANGVAADGGKGGVHGKKAPRVNTQTINNYWQTWRSHHGIGFYSALSSVEKSLVNSSRVYAVRRKASDKKSIIRKSSDKKSIIRKSSDTWFIPQTTPVARGNTANGIKPTTLNEVGRVNAALYPPLDVNTLEQAYKTYFEGQSAQPMLAPFIRLFPGLDTSN